MSTSTLYVDAARRGMADALEAANVVCGAAPPTFTLGQQAVRSSGLQSHISTSSPSQGDTSKQEAALLACYAIGSIHDEAMQELSQIVNPSNPSEQRIAFLLQYPSLAFSSSPTGTSSSISADMRRQVAAVCDDILIAFHAAVMANHSLHLHSLVEACYAQLLEAKEGENKALAASEKKTRTIKALLESKARTDESRRRSEQGRVSAEKLIHVLAKQLDLEEKSSPALSLSRIAAPNTTN